MRNKSDRKLSAQISQRDNRLSQSLRNLSAQESTSSSGSLKRSSKLIAWSDIQDFWNNTSNDPYMRFSRSSFASTCSNKSRPTSMSLFQQPTTPTLSKAVRKTKQNTQWARIIF